MLIFPVLLLVGQQAPTHTPPDTKETLICHTVHETGSRLNRHRECKSARQWELENRMERSGFDKGRAWRQRPRDIN